MQVKKDRSLAGCATGEPPLDRDFITARWPHIADYLYIEPDVDTVEDRYFAWHFATEEVKYPDLAMAAALEEWADFRAWHFERRRPTLDNDRNLRSLVERWTDSMVYIHKRNAAHARGEDAGEWIPQHERRPDLEAEHREIVNEILADSIGAAS